MSIHIRHSALLLVAGGAFALLAVTAHGPLGLARLCGPRLHAVLDIVVALAVAAAPIVPALRPDITGIAVVEVAALAWVRLATLTRYQRAPGDPDVTTVAATGIAVVPPPQQTVDTPGVASTGAVVARGLGVMAGRSARRLPDAEEAVRGGIRQAGRHAARLQRAWRKPTS